MDDTPAADPDAPSEGGVRVGAPGDFPEGEGREVDVDGRAVAVFREGGRLFALDNACPHRGGPLAEGTLADGRVSCPWHGWRFDLGSGACLPNPAKGAACHRVQEDGNDVWVIPG